jgi:hypothetical protein
MKKKFLVVNVIGTIAGMLTLILVVTSLVYFLSLKPFHGRQRVTKDFWERMEEQYSPRSRRHMERMWRKYKRNRFDKELWEEMRNKWREDYGEEFSEDFWEWLEKMLEEYLGEEPETESI